MLKRGYKGVPILVAYGGALQMIKAGFPRYKNGQFIEGQMPAIYQYQ